MMGNCSVVQYSVEYDFWNGGDVVLHEQCVMGQCGHFTQHYVCNCDYELECPKPDGFCVVIVLSLECGEASASQI